MKIFFLIFITLLFIGCSTTKPKNSIAEKEKASVEDISFKKKETSQTVKEKKIPKVYPKWYKDRNLKITKNYEIIGYGEGKTIKEAKANAKDDIAQTLSSKIDSSFKVQSIVSNNIYTKKSESNIKITSKLNLENIKMLKQDYDNNFFYVALKYENLDLSYRIKMSINNFECNEIKSSNYLLQTPLIKKITTVIGCELNFKLDRRNNAWYIKYKEHLFLLTNDEYEELYITKLNKKFSFTSNKKVLTDGNSFYFTVKSKKNGYITLLNVYENGITTLLQPSISINKTIQVPPKYGGSYFEAGLVEDGVNTYDLYVAIYTEEPLDMSRFEYANEDLAESEFAYKFDELIQVMSEYEYSSILIRTISR